VALVVLADERLFVVDVIAEQKSYDPEKADRFLDSFEVKSP